MRRASVRSTATLLILLFATIGCVQLPTAEPTRFELANTLTVRLPDGHETVRIWLPLPRESACQRVDNLVIESPLATSEIVDRDGNRFVFIEARRTEASRVVIETRFDLYRTATIFADLAPRPDETTSEHFRELSRWLRPEDGIDVDGRVQATASRLKRDGDPPVVTARRIYDWLIANVDHWVKDPLNEAPSGIGSSSAVFSSGSGDSEDFHALFTALARAAGIPTRMVYGSLLREETGGPTVDQGVHAWVEFFSPEHGWVPVDAALADIYVDDFTVSIENASFVRFSTATAYQGPQPARVDYYFGNLDDRRVAWNVGRDLELEPRPQSGPLRALPKAHVEVDGRALQEGTDWTRTLTYRRIDGSR